MNRADKMLGCLRGGEWWSRHDLQEHSGFYLTNNAASELWERGLTVEKRVFQGNIEYRVVRAPIHLVVGGALFEQAAAPRTSYERDDAA